MSQSQSCLTTYGKSDRLFWYQATMLNLRPISHSPHGNYLQTFAVDFSISILSDERMGL
jgi:hypothetical protein